jgi:DNA polymerase
MIVSRIDFETRSKVNVTQVGAWIYSLHPSTEVLCMAYKVGKKRTRLWVPGDPFPEALAEPVAKLWLFEAHNKYFEQCIWNNIMVKKHSFPSLPIKVWRCSAAKAAHYCLPRSLEKAGAAIGAKKQKDMEGHLVMMQCSRPRKPTKNNPSMWFDDKTRLKKVYQYCKDDVESEYSLSTMIPPLPKLELKHWKLDQRINQRGVYCDTELVIAALRIIEILEKRALKRVKELTNGQVETTGQLEEILKYCADHFVFLDNMQAETISRKLKEELPEEVREILELRQLMSKASTKKFQAMLNRVDPTDQRIRELILYYGAERTGRWAGKGIQIQNFPRGEFKDPSDIETIIELVMEGDIESLDMLFGNVTGALSSILRSCLCAEPGKTLIAGDFKSIEFIVLCWLSQCHWAVTMFNRGGDPYKDLASEIYSVPVKDVNSNQRFIGKQAVLGLGYQMGWKKFQADMDQKWNVQITAEFSKQVVETYRKKYWAVKQLWNNIEVLAKRAILDRTSVAMGSVPIKWTYEDDILICTLPNGRNLFYHQPKLKPITTSWDEKKLELSYMAIAPQSKKWVRIKTYGGKLSENCVQAISRDLLAEAMLRIERAKFPIVLTVHDEIVAEVEPEKADMKKYLDLLCVVPKWAEGLPIKAEGWTGERFRKD